MFKDIGSHTAVVKFTQTKEAQPQTGESAELPDSKNVALLAATKQIIYVHDPRTVFGPL